MVTEKLFFLCSLLQWESPLGILTMYEPSTISVSHTPEREIMRYGVKQVPLMHINTSDGKEIKNLIYGGQDADHIL